jgi:zinc protease
MRSAAIFLALAACGPSTRAPDRPPPAAPAAGAGTVAEPPGPGVELPIEYHELENGLKVVLSRDPAAPIVTVAVYYGIGFRVEPKGRTGFAHLFEHMMFQGSQNLGKMEFIRLVQANGGVLNGSTRFDFTNYFETVPSHVLETAIWAEADRLRGLVVSEENLVNQKGVVSNEVRVNVLNQPYGNFPLMDIPMAANRNWYNAHNFYGDLADLEAAKLEEVQEFFKTYYVPSNAALAIVGDFDPAQALAWVKKYFADIPAGSPPPQPDLREPRQTAERRQVKQYPQADRPALAAAWHMPDRGTRAYWAMAYVLEILADGKDSLLHRSLVQKRGYTGSVDSAINMLGHQYNYRGPMLLTVILFHDATTPADKVLAAIDEEVARLASAPVDAKTFDRARVKARARLYGILSTTVGRADALASAALFDGDPKWVNQIEMELNRVTPADVQAAAREVLRKENRTVVLVEPGKKGGK